MEVSPLAKKLQVKTGHSILICGAPEIYPDLLRPLPEGATLQFEATGPYHSIHLFVKSSAELAAGLKNIKKLLGNDTIFWVMYPKKTSGIDSDLNMMGAWKEPETYGWRPVASAAIDLIWTALRFRPSDQVKASGTSKAAIQNNEIGRYINVADKVITLPENLAAELDPASAAFFETLSWTNRKEYVTWILSAKQEKTKTERIKKAAMMLALKKKNPAEK